MSSMRILAIETSCDETAAAVIRKESSHGYVVIESSIVASQASLHAKYGGVYPEVASREHVRHILPVIAEALGLKMPPGGRLPKADFSSIDRIAVTIGPGLIGSLLVGVQSAATISLTTGIPLFAINHLAGHVYASFIQQGEEKVPKFPLLAMIVSGGHTLLVLMKGHYDFQVIGETLDDAAGEAFDKVARLLELGYPGGPEISRMAVKGNRHAFQFPIALAHDSTYNFSFSGLKTAVLRQIQKESKPLHDTTKADVAASFERVVVESLLVKLNRALDDYPVRSVILGGGVAANSYLRQRMSTLLAHRIPEFHLFVPPIELCTDNGAVIGAAAAFCPDKPTKPGQIQAYSRLGLVSGS